MVVVVHMVDIGAGGSGVGEAVDHVLDDQVQAMEDQVVDEETEVGHVFVEEISDNQAVDEGIEVGQVLDEVLVNDQVLVVLLVDVLFNLVVEVVQLVVVLETGEVCVYPQPLELGVMKVELVLVGHE